MPGDDRDRRKTPSAGAPVVPRTFTPDEVVLELSKLRGEVMAALRERPPTWYTQTVERHERAINEWMAQVGRKLPGQLAALEQNLGALAANVASVDAAAKSLRDLAGEIRSRLDEHGDRLNAHSDAIATIREDVTESQTALVDRIAKLEAHQAGDNRELALTRKQQLKRDGVLGLITTLGGAIAGWLTGGG